MLNGKTEPKVLVTLASPLGWMALVGRGEVLLQLVFGYPTRRTAIDALEPAIRRGARRGWWNEPLLRQLLDYAHGAPVDFRGVKIDPGFCGAFARRVVAECRKVPYGRTATYGQLAARAGSPRAARAVGNCMAANRIPLVVPCHRIVPAGGRLGAFSAPGGPATKRRLLEMEATSLAAGVPGGTR